MASKKSTRARTAGKQSITRGKKLPQSERPDLGPATDTLTRARHMLKAAIKCHDACDEEVDIGWATYEIADMLDRVQKDLERAHDYLFVEGYNTGGGPVPRSAWPRQLGELKRELKKLKPSDRGAA